ncbi:MULTISPECIES: iron-containing redox enzyme family protein [unclassified Kitasatospora]|uniref:iron-containing redox enzyme family protein n=1 Tax=unclassified Kitasatospora TaxID=2633591 RepID=UPI0009EA7987|nr:MULTISPECIES: iron-containing redox enzyme family protein [unclassified Kitasatospora]
MSTATAEQPVTAVDAAEPAPGFGARPSREFVESFLPWLTRGAEELDRAFGEPAVQAELLDAIRSLAVLREAGDEDAFFAQQYLLSRIYALHLQLPSGASAEGSVVLHAVTRRLELDTMAAEDARLDEEVLAGAPEDAESYVPWLKEVTRAHRAFKHPYYHEFVRNEANPSDLRRYIVQESAVDSRFDDLLALMQLGTSGGAKLEIATNFWDEMGNGDPLQVHTLLFGKIIDSFGISDAELEGGLTAEALLSGNLAVLCCRYRSLFPEAVGFLAMTEWLVPDRFSQVLHAWRRLDLPPAAIVYHDLHIGVDAHHASGWFANVVKPAAADSATRRAMTRGALWRLNSSARYLDHSLAWSR